MRRREPDPQARGLADKIVKFVNLTWGRKLRPSLGLVQAVDEALEAGYTPDQIRAVYWTAACGGDDFIKRVLHPREGRGPELALRHKGGTNPDSGKPAVRWLDALWEKVGEMDGRQVAALVIRLRSIGMSENEISEELALLDRIEAPREEEPEPERESGPF